MKSGKVILAAVVVVVVVNLYLYTTQDQIMATKEQFQIIPQKVIEEEEETRGGGGGGGGRQEDTIDNTKQKEEEDKQEAERRQKEEEERKQTEKKRKEEEERKKEEKMEEEKKYIGGGNVRKRYWVEEVEEYSPSQIDVEEMSGEMEERRRKVEERCREIFTPQEREKINSKEFLISDKYKLIWCNIFKSASSTWLYNYLIMGGKNPEELKKHRSSPVEAARELYPRPSEAQLRALLAKGDKEQYLSFVIVREPFQRLLSAYRDKIETIVPYYKSLRCKITQKYPLDTEKTQGGGYGDCTPTFSQFVSYIIDEEKEGRESNEHWAPFYSFCSPCSAHFDVVMRFESLRKDEMYLLAKVPGLSKVISPIDMHSSHFNYTALTPLYFKQLTAKQLIGLLNIYLPDFRLFGYNERKYFEYVL